MIRLRLVITSCLLLGLLYLLFNTASYGLTREAQFEALRKKLLPDTKPIEQPEHQLSPQEDLTVEIPPKPPLRPPLRPPRPSPPLEAGKGSDQTKDVTATGAGAGGQSANNDASEQQPPGLPAQAVKATPATSSSSISLPTPSPYTRGLVIARTKAEIGATAWMAECRVADYNLRVFPYTVDDPSAELHVPKNKGHEAMVYLSYIIDHYDEVDGPLPDVSLFMHAHKITWHNNDLLDSSSVNIVKHLSTEKVLRDGYFNLRCHLDPGCPAHLHPSVKVKNPHRPEETEIVNVWPILFPGEPVPEVLSHPCCSQFALSRDRILSLPKSKYEDLRNWLATTPLPDVITGRIFEYVWQKIWTGQNEVCPIEHVCYSDGYGICFGNKTNYDLWFERRKEFRELAPKLQAFVSKQEEEPAADWLHQPLALEYRARMEDLRDVLAETREEAIRRGKDPKLRAQEAGREWKEGDGY